MSGRVVDGCGTSGPGGAAAASAIALLQRRNALLLVVARPLQVRRQGPQPVPVFLGLAKDVGHLPLQRVEPLVERRDRRLGRRRLVGKAGGVRRPAARKHLALDLLDLPFEALEALLGRRRRALRPAPPGGARRRHRPRGRSSNAMISRMDSPLRCDSTVPRGGFRPDESGLARRVAGRGRGTAWRGGRAAHQVGRRAG